METIVFDVNGVKLAVGMRVAVDLDDPTSFGLVEEISDPDGDVNDEGRGIAINPSVSVRFDDGSEDSFTTWWTATGPWDDMGAPYRCDDVEVVA
jgi:hypothetical protein